VWVLSQQKEFDDLKKHFFIALVISLPNLEQPFEIDTYASNYVVGTFITQYSHPVTYHSETLTYVVYKYPTYEK